jgi:hypothetical protein
MKDEGRPRERHPVQPLQSVPLNARTFRAMMLARTPEVCQALLRGELVLVDDLDPYWVAWFRGPDLR